MENFPSNSREPKVAEDETPVKKPVLKVVEGDVVRRKKPLSARIRDMFVVDDTKSVFSYVVEDVLIPAAKDMINDAVSQGMERMIFGDSKTGRRRPSAGPSAFGNTSNRVAYNRYSNTSRREERPSISRRSRSVHNFDEIILASRADAERVIDDMVDLVRKYQVASVKDLYQLLDVEFHYTDEKYGWTNLEEACVRRVSNGYLLKLPDTELINE